MRQPGAVPVRRLIFAGDGTGDACGRSPILLFSGRVRGMWGPDGMAGRARTGMDTGWYCVSTGPVRRGRSSSPRSVAGTRCWATTSYDMSSLAVSLGDGRVRAVVPCGRPRSCGSGRSSRSPPGRRLLLKQPGRQVLLLRRQNRQGVMRHGRGRGGSRGRRPRSGPGGLRAALSRLESAGVGLSRPAAASAPTRQVPLQELVRADRGLSGWGCCRASTLGARRAPTSRHPAAVLVRQHGRRSRRAGQPLRERGSDADG